MTISQLKPRLLPFHVPHVTNLGGHHYLTTTDDLRRYQNEMIEAWGDVTLGLSGYKTWGTIDPDYHTEKNAQLSAAAQKEKDSPSPKAANTVTPKKVIVTDKSIPNTKWFDNPTRYSQGQSNRG